MDSDVWTVIDGIWVAAALVWVVSAFAAKPAERRQSPASRLTHVLLLVLAFVLLFDGRLNIGFLNRRFAPYSDLVQYSGMLLTFSGVAFAIWARFSIGTNWSASVTVKHNHLLIRSGPYAIVRHPIYSGFLLAFLGTALATAEYRGLFGLALAVYAWRMKSLIEERFMSQQFGTAYSQYERDVKALIPFLW